MGGSWRQSAFKKGNTSCKDSQVRECLICLKNKNSKEADMSGGK